MLRERFVKSGKLQLGKWRGAYKGQMQVDAANLRLSAHSPLQMRGCEASRSCEGRSPSESAEQTSTLCVGSTTGKARADAVAEQVVDSASSPRRVKGKG